MITAFKSEVRKVLSLRSTWIILLMCFGLMVLFDFYVVGWHRTPDTFMSPDFLRNQVVNTISFLSLLTVIVAMLNVTHEYRYNTITYTLTSSRSRSQVFVAKFLTVFLFGILFTVLMSLLAPLLTMLAAEIRGFDLVSQTWNWWNLVWQAIYGGLAFMLYAFILAMLIRTQVGAIVTFYLIPTMLEPILGLLLKKNAAYLPFQSLNLMMGTGPSDMFSISQSRAALMVSGYIVVGLLFSWLLFLRRDAN